MPPIRAIVRAGRTAALSNPYARAGYTAYNYGPAMARAAYKIGRFAYRRYRARSRRPMRKRKRVPSGVGRHAKRRVGHPVGKSNAKRTQANFNERTDTTSKTLYGVPLTQLSIGDDLNERVRGMINCRGFQVCSEVRNNHTGPLYFNMAIVHAKNEVISTIDDLKPNFFRGNSTQRGINFAETGISALGYHCNNLNTDALNVIKHKRYKLTEKFNSGPNKSNNGNSWMVTKWWVPLKRQLRYDRAETTEPEGGHIWLVWWCDKFGGASTEDPIVSMAQVNTRTVMYYKETCSC